MGMIRTTWTSRTRRTPWTPCTATRAVVTAAALVLVLAACGQGTVGGMDPTSSPDAEPSVPAAPPVPLEPSAPGSADPGPGSPAPSPAALPADPSGAELTFVAEGPDGPQPPVTLSCDFATGTGTGSHPQAAQACTDLQAALTAGDPFAPVPPDAMCTQQYGGDAVVEVTGAVLAADGGPVDVAARYALSDGCEIDRWERLGAVLAPFRGSV